MTEVITLYNERHFAACPDCGQQDWLIEVNGRGASWTRVLGTECSNCGRYISWSVVAMSPEEIDKRDHEEIENDDSFYEELREKDLKGDTNN